MENGLSRQAITIARDMRFRTLERNGTGKAALDAFETFLTMPGTLDRESLIVRCTFREGGVDMRVVLDREKSRRRLHTQFEPFLQRIAAHIDARADVFILVSDTIYVAAASKARFAELVGSVPFLRCDALDDEAGGGALLIPDHRMLDPVYARDYAAVTAAAARIPFEARRPVMGWRGRLSGPVNPDLENCTDFPRYHLLMQAMRHPGLIDARLTNYTNLADTASGVALAEKLDSLLGGTVPELRPDEFTTYRYLIAVDGVTAPWKTVPMHLATGSVLLMQHRWKQYFHAGLKPWTHYVPLSDDMAELAQLHAWLEQNPDKALAIASAGQRFARDLLNPAEIDAAFIDVIERCARLPFRAAA